MASPARDIASLLQTLGVGTEGTDIFLGRIPEETDLSMALFDLPGIGPDPRWKRDDVLVQIVVRGNRNEYQTTYNFAQSVKDALLACNPTTINGSLYSLIVMLGDVGFIGYDDDQRPKFLMNFRVVRDNAPGGSRGEL